MMSAYAATATEEEREGPSSPSRRQLRVLGRVAILLLAATAVIVSIPLVVLAQPPAQQQPPAVPPPEQESPIDLTEATGYTYDAKGRRDPFRSLVSGPVDERMRPPGLGGMLIQEVSLRGIVKTGSGFIAMIQGTDNKSYFARAGERLYDGSIDFIVQDKVVFRQEINDPLRIEKFQKVEKSLYPVEEGKK